MILIGYHPDFGNAARFREQSRLGEVAANLHMSVVFPNGRFVWGVARGWRDRDTWRGKPSRELARFDALTRGRRVVLCGYSDGGGVANYLATYRSEQVAGVVSYAARLQRHRFETRHKFPVLDVWNERDARRNSRKHLRMVADFRMNGHQVSTVAIPNGKGHAGGWDPDVNRTVESFLRYAVAE